MNEHDDVRAFHEKFGLPHRARRSIPLAPDLRDFRAGFLREEADEFRTSLETEDLVGAIDALVDFVYVVHGTILHIGAPSQAWPVFRPFGVRTPRLPPSHVVGELADMIAVTPSRFVMAHDAAVGGCDPRVVIGVLKTAVRDAHFAAGFLGAPWEACWAVVQKANMTKVRAGKDGSDSKRGSAWDVVKPPGWRGPEDEIRGALVAAGWKGIRP